jgi:hypothetical protein
MVGSIKSLEGDLHEWNFKDRCEPRSVFIDCAVQEPEHDFEER